MARSLREAGHLPNRREPGDFADPNELPRQRRGTTPQMHGRYPDYDVLSQVEHWDEATRRVVLERVEKVPPIRFFSPEEEPTLRAFCDVVTAQDAEPRVQVLNYVDAKLFEGKLDGFQFAELPDDRDTWRLVARGLDEAAGGSYADAPHQVKKTICKAFADGKLEGGVWDELPPDKAWKVVTRAILSCFYAHPWTWNEIGFGGPAYPRGYAAFGVGTKEHWEGYEAWERDPVQADQ
jgi:hypothetical protein